MKNVFLTQFIHVKKYIPPKQNLSRVYQGPNESLKDWIASFGEQVATIEGITDEVALMEALVSIKKDIPYNIDLDRIPPQTYQEFLTRAQRFINAEEAKKILKAKWWLQPGKRSGSRAIKTTAILRCKRRRVP